MLSPLKNKQLLHVYDGRTGGILKLIKGTKKSTLGKNSLVLLMHHDLSDFGLICLVMKHKIPF